MLKSKEILPFQPILKPLTEGKWKDRNKRISEAFKTEIKSIETNLDALEEQRLTRNAIAHQFGLEGDLRFFEKVDPSYFERSTITISTDDIRNNFKIIREISDEVEKKIAGPNIGIFKYLLFIHNYKNDIDNFRNKMPPRYGNFTLEKMINTFLTDNGLQRITRAEAREVIKYYNNA